MTDNFLGSWLVSEYVYNPDGTFAGIVHQRRQLHRLDSGNIRVVQHCTPGPELAAHPMGAFAGEWEFELSIDGRARRYHGPDVIGTGLFWGDAASGRGAMTGRGLWPRFGHNFTSFAVLPTPERQITGGKFFNVSEMVANIIGLAVLESKDKILQRPEWPIFNGPYWPGEISAYWRGIQRNVNADGRIFSEMEIERYYTTSSWNEGGVVDIQLQQITSPFPTEVFHVTHAGWGETLTGLAQRVGWLLEIEVVAASGITMELMEVLDVSGGNLIGLRKWRKDDVLQKVEVLKLKPTNQHA